MRKQLAALVEKISKIENIETANTFLRSAKLHFEAENISYVGVNLPNPTHEGIFVRHTYGPEWEKIYLDNNYFNIDPVIRHSLISITPTDWAQFKNSGSQEEKAFWARAYDHGVGSQGISFTVRGRLGETGIFSANKNLCNGSWDTYKHTHMSDMQMVATYFHGKIVELQEKHPQAKSDTLSSRELECLKWCSAGKSYWETSVILGISERTVNFHMTTVRQKLNAMTNAQAVANAIHQGIISLS